MENESANIPLVLCLEVAAKPPSLQDNTGDVDRLKNVLKPLLQENGLGERECEVPFATLQKVADRFRRADFHGCALLNVLPGTVRIVDFLPQAPERLAGMALDLGTTHIEATLLDLDSGKLLASSHAVNDQIRYGTDILSRMHFAVRKAGQGEPDLSGLAELQQAVVGSINGLAADLAGQARMDSRDIRALTISGNTTMVHLLLGLNPYHICREPYIPLVNAPDPFCAGDLGITIAPLAPVWIMPSIGSYFGGDLVSGILASGLDQAATTQMLIDVGTNAEVVLGNRDWLIACAGAAGPALEGGVARMGMRAAPGAVEYVRIDTDRWELEYRTIDNAPAAGICGSGMIDLAAELYLAQIIDFRGRLNFSQQPGSPAHRSFLAQRLQTDEEAPCFIVVPAEESVDGRPVVFSQLDIDAMMRSKAAMFAILSTLVGQVGVEFGELEQIHVAGAFGRHIDPAHAVIMGMIPDLPLSTYVPIGNSSLRGAELVLLSESSRQRCQDIRRKVTYLELNVNQEFMIRFSGSRFIPHTDQGLFPSVPSFRQDR